MSKKGVSAEEKRRRMLELFHETQDFYQIKDLEKIAPKSKGIIAQSVKDVVKSLADDGLVQCEIIGSTPFYYSFPDQAVTALEKKVQQYEERKNAILREIQENKKEIKEEEKGKDTSDERDKIIENMQKLETLVENLKQELKKHEDNDPVAWNERKNEIKTAKEAANRWTDNVFAIKNWIVKKFNQNEELINKQFGIPSDLDYIN